MLILAMSKINPQTLVIKKILIYLFILKYKYFNLNQKKFLPSNI